MKTKGDKKDMMDAQCVEQANMDISLYSQLRRRSGFVKQNTTSLGAATRSLFGYRGKSDSTSTVIVAHSTKLETV